jgi:hypothetical protein
MKADKHRLSDQVGQLQSKIDRAALHRDLIVGMEHRTKNPISFPILTTISVTVAIIPDIGGTPDLGTRY